MNVNPIVTGVELKVIQATWRASWMVLEITDSGGRHGLAECSGPGATAEARAEIEAVMRRLQGKEVALVRADPCAAIGVSAPVAHAVELALADVQAKTEGSELDLIPPNRYRSRIPLYANINRAERDRIPSKLAALGASAATDGFPAVKIAPFDDANAHDGLLILRAVRAAIGPEVELMVDCHNRLPLSQVLQILPDLEGLDVTWLEDVLGMNDIDGWSRLATATRVPLAAGEQATTLADLRPLLRSGVLCHVLPDVQIAGVRGCHEILTEALRLGVGASLHNPTGPVGTAASLLVAAALPSFGRLEFAYGEVPWRGGLLIPPEQVQGAALTVPAGPGLGVTLSGQAYSRASRS